VTLRPLFARKSHPEIPLPLVLSQNGTTLGRSPTGPARRRKNPDRAVKPDRERAGRADREEKVTFGDNGLV